MVDALDTLLYVQKQKLLGCVERFFSAEKGSKIELRFSDYYGGLDIKRRILLSPEIYGNRLFLFFSDGDMFFYDDEYDGIIKVKDLIKEVSINDSCEVHFRIIGEHCNFFKAERIINMLKAFASNIKPFLDDFFNQVQSLG